MSVSLAWFHHVIQFAMDWDDDYLHKFRIYGKDYSIHYQGGGYTVEITLGMTIMDVHEPVIQQNTIHLNKSFHPNELIGLSFDESKQLLKTLQQQIIEHQARQFIQSQKRCPRCENK